MSTKSTTPRATYSVMKTARLTPSIVELTFGDDASAVLSRPWTIHGCRPTSVSTQPASAARKGAAIVATAVHRNQRVRSSRPRQYKKAPSAATRKTSVPRYAMIRMPQYVARTGGM